MKTRNKKNTATTHNAAKRRGFNPKIVSKRYNVTSQTAYHITELALMENTTEGRIVDKMMRTYLASQETCRDHF